MKRALLALMTILALAIMLSAASADGQHNPRWQHVRDALNWSQPNDAPSTRGGVSVSLECVSEPTLDDPGEFRAAISGGDPADYVVEFCIQDEGRDPFGYLYFGGASANLTFNSVQLCSTGDYSVLVYLLNADDPNTILSVDYYDFTLTGPESASLEYKAAQIVAECRGADDWHTALNLHDWLTHNAYYDLNYEYYGADIMLRGYGVCDSYSKAYKMLCLAAGITNDRIISDQLNHAWNAITLNGKWYQVDVTWDDPAGDAVAVSGWEGYDYFCLNDVLMSLDHNCTDATFTPGCTSLDANYYIHENMWQRYGVAFITDENGSWILNDDGGWEHDIIACFAEAIYNGETEVTLSWDGYHNPDDGYWYGIGDKEFILFAYGLESLEWSTGDSSVSVRAMHELGTKNVTLRVVDMGQIIAEGQCGDDVTYTLTDNGVLTVSGTGDMWDFNSTTVPWVDLRNDIISVVISDGVSSIGFEAFLECRQLSDVNLSDSVAYIGTNAFGGCERLFSIEIPTSVTEIGELAFQCTGLTSIVIPNSVTVMGRSVFRYCVDLESVVLPDNLTEIAPYMFDHCESLVGIDISDEVLRIGHHAFQYCAGLQTFTIPQNTSYIGAGAFAGCTGISEFLVVSENDYFTSVDGVLFTNNLLELIMYPAGRANTAYSVPETVVEIDNSAFAGCSHLETVVVPEGVVYLGNNTFEGCSDLSSVILPDSLSSLPWNTFMGCTKLESVVLPSGLTEIPPHTFDGCNCLTDFAIPDSVTSIGTCAFVDCSNLTSIVIPDGVTAIEGWTFVRCSSLTSILIPDTVTSIGELAFADCSSLPEIIIPENVTSIGDSAFLRCEALTSIRIPAAVTFIGRQAFLSCNGLRKILVDDSNTAYTDIDGVLFDKAVTYLHSFPAGKGGVYTIPEGITSIPNNAFYQCMNLTGVIIPNGVTTIEADAFFNAGLTEVYIPRTVSGIQSNAFLLSFVQNVYYEGSEAQWNTIDIAEGNAELIKAVKYYNVPRAEFFLPASLTSIGSRAFTGIAAEAVAIPRSVTSIAADAFDASSISAIYGFAGSAAEAFANAHEIVFIMIDDSWFAGR